MSGDDWHFGKDKRGDVCMLDKMCNDKNIGFTVVERLKIDGETVSSSLIRSCIADGNIKKANALLGREYTVEGMVTEGKRLGGKIGFPTVNFASEKGRILPQKAV